MTDTCPKCNATYPNVYTMTWSGGNHLVETHHHCKKCGIRFTRYCIFRDGVKFCECDTKEDAEAIIRHVKIDNGEKPPMEKL
jgi:transcriptional regulator NrdR family protein